MFFLVLRRTLNRGWRSGLISGLGIASGDAIYAAIAAFGVVAVINLLVSERRWIGLAGGLAIAAIGIRTLVRSYAHPAPAPKGKGDSVGRKGQGEVQSPLSDYGSTLGLTLSNPPTILSFIAVFAGLGVHISTGWQPAAALVVGVMLGSALWWAILTMVVAQFRGRISSEAARAISVATGLALIVFGVLITLQSL